MTTINIDNMRNRIIRRIAVKTVVIACWIAGMVAVMLSGSTQDALSFFAPFIAGLAAVWVVSTMRDVRRLRNEAYLQQAAIAENDERNILITYKATRLAAVVTMCAIPVAMCVLAYFGMQDVINALGLVVCGFLVIYVAAWAYLNRTR